MGATMMIVMKGDATEAQIAHVVERIGRAGARAHVSAGEFVTVIGAIGDDRELIAALDIDGEPGVEKVVPILKPYKLVSRDFRGPDAAIEIAGRKRRKPPLGVLECPFAPCALRILHRLSKRRVAD